MKRIQFILLFIFVSKFCIGQEEETLPAGVSGFYQNKNQEYLRQITSLYFRSNPYDREFGQFLDQLVNDPAIVNKIVIKRTDSTFYYFKGVYKNFNPFFYKATRTEITLAEIEIVLDDSTGKLDTIMAYQLLGYSVGSNQGKKDVKDEFEKFQRRVKKKFLRMEPTDFKNGDEITGQIQNYFFPTYSLSPLGVAWGKLTKTDEYVFAITLRMKYK